MRNTVKTVQLPRPHAGQIAVFSSAKRFNWLSAGRRWRKTSGIMANVAIPRVLDQQRVIWAAPTHKQTTVAWEECQRAAGKVATFNKTEQTASFPGGGRIMFFSMEEPDNARGHTADGIVVDEAADVPEVAWHEVLRPMLFDTRGWAWLAGTPKGRNYFWREWMGARDRPDAMAWQAPALGVQIDPSTQKLIRVPHPLENTELALAELEDIWATTPERAFRQEYLAEFLEDGGSVFRGVRAQATGQRREPYKGHFGIGVDLGKINDFTVLTVVDLEKRTVVDWVRFNQIDWPAQQGRLRQMWIRWSSIPDSSVTMLVERNMAGDPMIDALRRDGLPVSGFHTNSKTKRGLIEDLVLAIERGHLTYPHLDVMIDELEAYEQDRSDVTGIIRYRAPDGLHDDAVISLALAWRLIKNGKPIENQEFRFTQNSGTKQIGLIEEYRLSLQKARRKALVNNE